MCIMWRWELCGKAIRKELFSNYYGFPAPHNLTKEVESRSDAGSDDQKPSRDDLTKMEASEAGFPFVAQ